jgi:hypothetical protein
LILGLLVLVSPLGLLAEGAAWAEWGADELEEMLGFVPEGLAGLAEVWSAPAPDYSLGGLEANVGYILSGVAGIAAVVAATWLLGRWLSRGGADG